MSGRVDVDGLRELRHFIATADAEIRAEAVGIVKDTTRAALGNIQGGYPVGQTGNLRSRVRAIFPSGGEIVGVVLSAAPHAHLWEFGTKKRRTSTGANRGAMWGRTAKPSQVMVPVAERHRAEMFIKLVAMIRRFGFEVSGV